MQDSHALMLLHMTDEHVFFPCLYLNYARNMDHTVVQNINKVYEQVEGKVLKSNFTFKPVISAHSEFIWPQCKERVILLGTLAFF